MIRYLKKAYKLYRTPEFESWFEEQTYKEQLQILERLSKIELDGYFGSHKRLNAFIWELKWISGRRLYYTYVTELNVLLLLGGNKNGQEKDIKKANSILKKYTTITT